MLRQERVVEKTGKWGEKDKRGDKNVTSGENRKDYNSLQFQRLGARKVRKFTENS